MNTSKIIRGVVSNGRYTVTAPIVKEDYGLYLKIEGVELPPTYQVDFSNSESNGTSVTMIGNADGVLIPHQFIDTGKDIFAFLYHVGANYGRTVYKFRIPNKLRPDRTNEEPTPEEQSTIDQAISALNEAVEQTAQDVISADASAQSAQGYAEQAESARDTAQTYANNASASATSASESATASANSATASANSASQSAQIKADVEGMVSNAQGYANSASQSANASANSASYSQGYAQSASASASSASGYASSAQTSANTASNKASEASQSATMASDKATEAAQSATNASQSAQTAEQAKTASQTAQGLAESARDGAVQAKTDAESAKDDAVQAKTDAESAKDDAVQAKTDAESAKDDAVQAKEDAESAVASISGALADKADVITDTASGSIASFSDGADNLPLKSLVVNIDPVQDLHGQESPYPAGGGKNLFNGTFLQGYWAYANGAWINSRNWITTEKIPCKASTSYTVSADAKATRWQGFVWYDSNGDFISTDNLNGSVNIGLTKTSPSNAAYLIFNIAGYPSANDTIAPSDVTHFQLEEGSSSTAYAPYSNICPISGWTGMQLNANGTVIPISWQTEAGTVYGGMLDVTTGKLTVDRAMVDLGAKNWYPSTAAGRTRFRTSITDIERISSPNVRASLLCSNYPTKTANQTYQGTTGVSLQQNSADIYIYDPQMESMTGGEFKSAMSGVQLCYELAEPIEIQLSANQINSLYGQNNLWADSGDTTAEYRADTKLYIERLTAPDSADMIADANITSGQYFMVGNSLYKATANIANGAQIIVGTNCTRVSLAQALNEINA